MIHPVDVTVSSIDVAIRNRQLLPVHSSSRRINHGKLSIQDEYDRRNNSETEWNIFLQCLLSSAFANGPYLYLNSYWYQFSILKCKQGYILCKKNSCVSTLLMVVGGGNGHQEERKELR